MLDIILHFDHKRAFGVALIAWLGIFLGRFLRDGLVWLINVAGAFNFIPLSLFNAVTIIALTVWVAVCVFWYFYNEPPEFWKGIFLGIHIAVVLLFAQFVENLLRSLFDVFTWSYDGFLTIALCIVIGAGIFAWFLKQYLWR